MKEHLSYEPNRGLSLVKEPCCVILTWTTMWGGCPCPHSLVVRYDRREMDPEPASDENVVAGGYKEQADMLAIRLYKNPGVPDKLFRFSCV